MCHIDTYLCLTPFQDGRFHLFRHLTGCYKGLIITDPKADVRDPLIAHCKGDTIPRPIHQTRWTFSQHVWDATSKGHVHVPETKCDLCPELHWYPSNEKREERLQKETRIVEGIWQDTKNAGQIDVTYNQQGEWTSARMKDRKWNELKTKEHHGHFLVTLEQIMSDEHLPKEHKAKIKLEIEAAKEWRKENPVKVRDPRKMEPEKPGALEAPAAPERRRSFREKLGFGKGKGGGDK